VKTSIFDFVKSFKCKRPQQLQQSSLYWIISTRAHPSEWNTWDSLAEVFMEKGESQIAIGFYKKSIALNPKNEYGKKMVIPSTP
jgi:cytochrome c-type biogenesis protein CcmH/NrfG